MAEKHLQSAPSKVPRGILLQAEEDHPYTALLQRYVNEVKAELMNKEQLVKALHTNGIDR